MRRCPHWPNRLTIVALPVTSSLFFKRGPALRHFNVVCYNLFTRATPPQRALPAGIFSSSLRLPEGLVHLRQQPSALLKKRENSHSKWPTEVPLSRHATGTLPEDAGFTVETDTVPRSKPFMSHQGTNRTPRTQPRNRRLVENHLFNTKLWGKKSQGRK